MHPGYLGAKPEDTVIRIGPPRFAVYGSNQNTNSWAPWYTQHKIMRGFLDAYTLTGNERAFEIVQKMAEWAFFAITLGDVMHPNYTGPPTRSDLNYMWDTYIAGELGGINEVMAEVAALTSDDRYMQVAKAFDNRESLFDACLQNRDILTMAPGTQPGRRRPQRLHANQHVPGYTGYMRIYEQTGDETYHTVAKNFFGMLEHRMFPTRRPGRKLPGLQQQHRDVPEPRTTSRTRSRRAARRPARVTTRSSSRATCSCTTRTRATWTSSSARCSTRSRARGRTRTPTRTRTSPTSSR